MLHRAHMVWKPLLPQHCQTAKVEEGPSTLLCLLLHPYFGLRLLPPFWFAAIPTLSCRGRGWSFRWRTEHLLRACTAKWGWVWRAPWYGRASVYKGWAVGWEGQCVCRGKGAAMRAKTRGMFQSNLLLFKPVFLDQVKKEVGCFKTYSWLLGYTAVIEGISCLQITDPHGSSIHPCRQCHLHSSSCFSWPVAKERIQDYLHNDPVFSQPHVKSLYPFLHLWVQHFIFFCLLNYLIYTALWGVWSSLSFLVSYSLTHLVYN